MGGRDWIYANTCDGSCKIWGGEGHRSLEDSFAKVNPHRLMMNESTAMGYNHWRDRYLAGKNNIYSERSFFLGWWACDTNRIDRSDPRFSKFGRATASGDERKLIHDVSLLYDWKITQEQLAWIRWKESTAGGDQDLLAQNNPWTEEQAFVQTGRSFFQMGLLNQDIKEIINANLRGADKSPYQFEGYRYEVDGDFFSFRMDEARIFPRKPRIRGVEESGRSRSQARGMSLVSIPPMAEPITRTRTRSRFGGALQIVSSRLQNTAPPTWT